MIRLEGIRKTYSMGKRELEVLRGVDLEVKSGEMLAIMGPSGSGKSTLLNIAGCLDVPTAGRYYLEGKEVSRLNSGQLSQVRSQKIGFVFQTFNLLPRMSALGNVMLGMRYVPGVNHQRERAAAALAKVGLSERATHRPTELSGGEQQRLAIARAIAKNPPLLLADEPTGNLDSHSGAEVMALLTALHNDQGITLVMITHDASVAHHCQRIVHLMDGQVVSEEVL
jgi:putative ABC transport system ATP-binding protein